jgi:hypothetical protein
VPRKIAKRACRCTPNRLKAARAIRILTDCHFSLASQNMPHELLEREPEAKSASGLIEGTATICDFRFLY